MIIENNNPNLIPGLIIIVAVGFIVYNIAGIVYRKIRLKRLVNVKGLIIENHNRFKKTI